MLDFLQANIGTIAVGLILVIILAAAFMKIRKDKKNGAGCGCGCSGCPSAGMCHGNADNAGDK